MIKSPLVKPCMLEQVRDRGPKFRFLLQALFYKVDAVWTALAERSFLELGLLVQDCRVDRHAGPVGETESSFSRQNLVSQNTNREHVSF